MCLWNERRSLCNGAGDTAKVEVRYVDVRVRVVEQRVGYTASWRV